MAEQATQNPQDLNIQDLATMKAIIDLASERNAFKPSEMAAVGIVYNKLDLFLKAVEEQAKAAKEAKADEESVAEEATDNG
jgi:uncharacterized protein YfkK (UPF0435 family)